MTGVLIFLALAPFALAFSNLQTERIVGGSAATIEEIPYIVLVSTLNNGNAVPACGGSIISESWVVTAAHCFEGASLKGATIRAGTDQFNTGGVVITASDVYVHPNFSSVTVDNDIALMKLSSPLTLSSKIASISLADSAIATGTSAVVSGWGYLGGGDNDTIPNQLQKVTIPIVSNDKCPGTVTEKMLCAGSSSGIESPCFGDSGGPLAVGNTLIGVVSHGDNCTGISVYANVFSYRDWISSIASI